MTKKEEIDELYGELLDMEASIDEMSEQVKIWKADRKEMLKKWKKLRSNKKSNKSIDDFKEEVDEFLEDAEAVIKEKKGGSKK